jgi:type II secretory pathway component GspD/PulD (secretin)
VVIEGVELQRPKEFRANGGRSYIVEFPCGIEKSVKLTPIDVAGVASFHASLYAAKPLKSRVVFRVEPDVHPEIVSIENGFKIAVGQLSFVKASDSDMMSNPLLAAAGLKPPSDGTDSEPIKQPTTNSTAGTPKKQPSTTPEPDIFRLPQVQPKEAGSNSEQVYAKTDQSKKAAPQPKPVMRQAAPTRRVSLDFVNTEVGVILKALTMQAGANIVTAPDIKGAITITLDRVTVDEALDMITALSGLRYARLNGTYVVAPKASFGDIMRQVTKSSDKASETRLVPIYSGEVDQIKEAVMRAFPTDNSKGAFDIIVPGGSDSPARPKSKANDGDKGGDAGGEAESVGARTRSAMGPLYVILVGNPDALDVAQRVVEAVDQSICKTYGVEIPASNEIVQETYLITSETMPAKTLLDTVRTQAGTAFQNVEMYPSPVSSDRQAIIIRGRTTEVQRARKMLEEFDGGTDEIMPYEVKYRDPRSLRDELMQSIPGLRVIIPAAPVTNVGAYEPPPKTKSSSKSSGGNESSSQETEQSKGPSDVQAKSADVNATGLVFPYSKIEPVARPMRLMLRGSKTQLDRAFAYLEKSDIAPKQVALDMRVMELSREEALRAGLDWTFGIGGTNPLSVRVNQALGDSAISPGTVSGSGSRGNYSFSNLLGTLDQLANNGNLIARPNVIAMDGRGTELFVGDVIRYVESIQSSQNGVTVTTSEVRVGVRCSVLLRVGADDRISMDLQPVISYLRGFTAVPGGGQLPQTSERIAQSSVQINNGETIVIGGLIKDEDRKIVNGVPLLKDLPIIGRLFSRTDNSRKRSEVVIFLTARVVNADSRGDAALPRANEQRNTENPVNNYPNPLETKKKK